MSAGSKITCALLTLNNYLVSVALLSVWTLNCAGQENRKPFLNELTVSGNFSVVNDSCTDNMFGVGLGLYHHSKLSEMFDLVSGIELNQLSQFKKTFFDGEAILYNDVTFNFYVFSLKCLPRLKLGNKLKFIVEAGPQADFGIYNYYKGQSAWYYHGTNGSSGNEKHSINYGFNLFGCVGVGLMATTSKVDLLIKSEYKIGSTKEYFDQPIRHRYIYFTIGLVKNKF